MASARTFVRARAGSDDDDDDDVTTTTTTTTSAAAAPGGRAALAWVSAGTRARSAAIGTDRVGRVVMVQRAAIGAASTAASAAVSASAAAAAATAAATARAAAAWRGARAADFDYVLPPERIAQFPLRDRSASKLLAYDGSDGAVSGRVRHLRFRDLNALLPSSALLVRNDTRVIAARLLLRKQDTRGRAEVLCLEPLAPSRDPAVALASREPPSVWSCLLGGRRIRPATELSGDAVRATVLARRGREAVVRLAWSGGESLARVLEREGRTPLPPYLKRADVPSDRADYQTVYAARDGSVAAPTAGLHFTPDMERQFAGRVASVTLHVGAGTFAPVTAEDVRDHEMHRERIAVDRAQLRRIVQQVRAGEPVVAVGTTSVRTLESLYWHGARLVRRRRGVCDRGGGGEDDGRYDGDVEEEGFFVSQWQPYEACSSPAPPQWRQRAMESGTDYHRRHNHDDGDDVEDVAPADALQAVLDHSSRDRRGSSGAVHGYTQMLIVPGYRFRVVDALVTNFHQPCSTLLMLVSAFVNGGRDTTMQLYEEAMRNGYRFLSYGDSSILARRPGLLQQQR